MSDFDETLDIDEDFDDLDEEEESRASKKKAPAKKSSKPKGIGASAVAEKLGANPKTFRAWLRRKVANGDIKIAEREAKARYTWPTWKDQELARIMKAWKEDSHEKGGGKKGKKAKKGESKTPAKKGKKVKKAPAKKRTKKAS